MGQSARHRQRKAAANRLPADKEKARCEKKKTGGTRAMRNPGRAGEAAGEAMAAARDSVAGRDSAGHQDFRGWGHGSGIRE
jgi:hypothetical protein